jgi:hypothetical protein
MPNIIKLSDKVTFKGCGINDDFIMDKLREIPTYQKVAIVQPVEPSGEEEVFNIFEVDASYLTKTLNYFEQMRYVLKEIQGRVYVHGAFDHIRDESVFDELEMVLSQIKED